jgi:Cof subfamily protein (haloacid dehalogenase superfamily)
MKTENTIQLVAADIDGTLLNHQGRLSPLTIQTITFLEQQGISFVLATGRGSEHFQQVRDQLHTEEFSQNGYIVYNGAEIYNGDCQRIYKAPGISISDTKRILQFAEKYDMEALCYTEDGRWRFKNPGFDARRLKYISDNSLSMEENVERLIGGNIDFSDSDIAMPSACSKIALLHSSLYLNTHLALLREHFPEYQIMMVTPSWLEIIPAGINKSSALKSILTQRRISTQSAAAFGDGQNDIGMLQSVKYGYAMANAFPDVLSQTDYHALSNDEDGVAKALIQLLDYDISLFNSFR